MRNIELTFNNFYFSFYVFLHCSLGCKEIDLRLGLRSEVCANGYKRDVLHPFLVGITFHRDTKSLEFGVVLYKLCQRASAHIHLRLNLNRHHTIVVLHNKVDLGRSLGIAPIIRLDSQHQQLLHNILLGKGEPATIM